MKDVLLVLRSNRRLYLRNYLTQIRPHDLSDACITYSMRVSESRTGTFRGMYRGYPFQTDASNPDCGRQNPQGTVFCRCEEFGCQVQSR